MSGVQPRFGDEVLAVSDRFADLQVLQLVVHLGHVFLLGGRNLSLEPVAVYPVAPASASSARRHGRDLAVGRLGLESPQTRRHLIVSEGDDGRC